MILPRPLTTAVRKSKKTIKKQTKTFEYKEFGAKSLDVLDNANAFLNILDGAVRSSKTITTTIKWLEFINRSPHDEFMQSGKTRTSLYRNVLRDELSMLEGFGVDYEHRPSDGYLRIEDNYIWLIGFAHEGIADIIRGMTIAGWYADETNTYPRSTVEEALDRLSLEGAQSYWTMNPDNPRHYINTDYILNQRLYDNNFLKRFHFELEDNPNLPPSYIRLLHERYPPGSVGYKRKIKGLWVVAEGIIYNKFIEAHHTFSEIPYTTNNPNILELNYNDYVLSMDYGPSTVSVIGLFGIKKNITGREYHLLREFYYDVNKNDGVQLTDEELAQHGLDLLYYHNQYLPLTSFFTPHDASSLRATLHKMRYNTEHINVQTYMPSTLEDIQVINSLFYKDKFKISTNCQNSIDCALTYSWDPKAQARDEDKPLKVDDHPADMWRGAILGSRNMGNSYTESNQAYEGSNYQRRLLEKNHRRRGRSIR